MGYKIFVCKSCKEEFGILKKDEAYLLKSKHKSSDLKFCKTCYREMKRGLSCLVPT